MIGEWRQKRSPIVCCIVALWLAAGCAAPQSIQTSISNRASATLAAAENNPPVLPGSSSPAPDSLVAPAPSGRARLMAHDSEAGLSSSQTPISENLSSEADESAHSSTSSSSTPSRPSYAIDLEMVLQLTDGQNPQVAFARERIQEAFAQVDRAQTLWLPSLRTGVSYTKHDGVTQQVNGSIINASRSALFTGFGGVLPGGATPAIPGLYANFQLVDAIFQPRIAERTAASRQSAATAARNDALLEAALAYFELLRAEQDLSIAREARRHTQELVDLSAVYATTGKGTTADHDRARAELALRVNDVQRGEEAEKVATVRLAQQLSLDPLLSLEPREPTIVPIELVSIEASPAELVARGLSNRPEVAENRQLAAEAIERLQREKFAPLIPSVLLGIGYGGFGGGLGGNIAGFNNSFDAVAGAFWEVRNLGLGERAARCEAQSRVQQAQYREIAALDRVAREVVEAHIQVQSRKGQIATAQEGVQAALASYERNLDRIKNVLGLPIEALQAIQALSQARREYLRTLIAYNEAQFRLQRALGWPVEAL